MGSFNDLPDNPASKAVSDQLIDDIKQNLQRFQQDLVDELTADVGRLQAEKVELLSTISALKREQKELQVQQHTLLSQQQIAQQKLWAKQLSEALANRLYVLLAQRIEQKERISESSGLGRIETTPMSTAPFSPDESNDNTQKALYGLNQNVSAALGALQTDLNRASSPLIHQMMQGESIDQQGEVLLAQLIEHLKQQLHSQPSLPSTSTRELLTPTQQVPSNSATTLPPPSAQPSRVPSPPLQLPGPPSSHSLDTPSADVASPPPITPPPQPFMERWAEKLTLSHFQLGVILVLLSTISLSLHNVVVGIIGNESSLFNKFPDIGGVVTLASLDSSLLLLWLRMIIVVPLMAGVATFLYPPAWRDVKSFFMSRDRSLLLTVIGSGGFLFFSQVLIYIAIGQVGPGIAVTLLFVYPIVTVPLAWFFFNDRPTALRTLVLAGVFFGIVLTMNMLTVDLDSFQVAVNIQDNLSIRGVAIALISGTFFAFYLISMQLSFRKLHPVPVSVIQFFTIFSLTSIILIIFPTQPENINLSNHLGLFVGALLLGGLTLAGYLLNNFGIRYMGAARASIIASSGPALTAFLGWTMVPAKNSLQSIQWLGIVLVTVCVASLSLERLFMQKKR